eukprot:8865029-Lingulodinium_polyedra.AAC.1
MVWLKRRFAPAAARKSHVRVSRADRKVVCAWSARACSAQAVATASGVPIARLGRSRAKCPPECCPNCV